MDPLSCRRCGQPAANGRCGRTDRRAMSVDMRVISTRFEKCAVLVFFFLFCCILLCVYFFHLLVLIIRWLGGLFYVVISDCPMLHRREDQGT